MTQRQLTTGDRIALAILPLPFTTLGLSLFTVSEQYVPEIFIITWIFFALLFDKSRMQVAKAIILSKPLIFATSIVVAASIFSVFREDFNPVSFYGRLRAILLCTAGAMAIIVSIQRGWGETAIECVTIICSSASLMYFAASAIAAQGDYSKISVSMICFSIATCLLVERRMFSWALAIATLCGLTAYFSFFRQNYIIAIYLILITTIFSTGKSLSIKNQKISISSQSWAVLAIPILVATSILSLWEEIIDFLSSSETRYIQSIGKSVDLINSLTTGVADDSGHSRLESYFYFLDNFPNYLLPNGLIDDASLSIYSIWGGEFYSAGISVVRDSVMGYLIVTFGFGLLLILLFIYITLVIISIQKAPLKTISRIVFIGPGLMMAFFVDGATLTQFQKSLFFGLACALLLPVALRRHKRKPPTDPPKGKTLKKLLAN